MRKVLIVTVIAALAAFTPVAEATELNLTTALTSGSLTGISGGTALFYQQALLSGTGRFPAFVQIGGNDDVVSAYNTTVNNVLSNGSSDQFNYAIQVSQLTSITVSGVSYYEFLLDINESNTGNDKWLSLDDIVVKTSTVANQSVQGIPAGGTVRWDMNSADRILLNYDLEAGSGNADMRFLVPTASFAGALSTDFVYLYSAFGGKGVVSGRDWGNSDGFEEWAFRRQTGPVPDGGITAFMLGLSMLGLGVVRRFRR